MTLRNFYFKSTSLRPLILTSLLMMFANSATSQTSRWIAGDHHIHSRYSVGWNRESEPPTPITGGDAIYPIHMNALMAKYFGLGWMVSTDHGGPNHSKVNLNQAYPELRQSRAVVPDIIQFYGMEFDTPGADHSSLIIPVSDQEAMQLYEIESRFSRREPWPVNTAWNTESYMLEALRYMKMQIPTPLLIANHPSRSAPGLGEYGLYTPAELRDWNDMAPAVAVGMSGAPGHQAATLNPDGSPDLNGARGSYRNYPTLGGYDQFTAITGGFWDSMLAEGRHWWITANSDSHIHYSEGGSDFWPGEYSKTYVWAEPNPDSIIEGIRRGRIFVTTGDLISELYVSVRNPDTSSQANLGETLSVNADETLKVVIRFRDPETFNNNGDHPVVSRVDLILGEVNGTANYRSEDRNPSTRVIARFDESDWTKPQGHVPNGKRTDQNNPPETLPAHEEPGDTDSVVPSTPTDAMNEYREIRYTLSAISTDSYLRVRGTAGQELEPLPDPRGEDPWSDLWFYSNPVFIELP